MPAQAAPIKSGESAAARSEGSGVNHSYNVGGRVCSFGSTPAISAFAESCKAVDKTSKISV